MIQTEGEPSVVRVSIKSPEFYAAVSTERRLVPIRERLREKGNCKDKTGEMIPAGNSKERRLAYGNCAGCRVMDLCMVYGVFTDVETDEFVRARRGSSSGLVLSGLAASIRWDIRTSIGEDVLEETLHSAKFDELKPEIMDVGMNYQEALQAELKDRKRGIWSPSRRSISNLSADLEFVFNAAAIEPSATVVDGNAA